MNKQNYLHDHHENFFKLSKNLSDVADKYFANIKKYENLVNNRHNIYCLACNHFKDLSI